MKRTKPACRPNGENGREGEPLAKYQWGRSQPNNACFLISSKHTGLWSGFWARRHTSVVERSQEITIRCDPTRDMICKSNCLQQVRFGTATDSCMLFHMAAHRASENAIARTASWRLECCGTPGWPRAAANTLRTGLQTLDCTIFATVAKI